MDGSCPEFNKTNSTATVGPNVRKMTAERAAQLMVEHCKSKYGSSDAGVMAHAILAGGLVECMREAIHWVQAALAAVRQAPGSERWPTDEDIAAEILRKLAERDKRKVVTR